MEGDGSYDAATWLPREALSAPAARRFVRHTLARWTVARDGMAQTVELLASELVTNALQHARSDVELRLRWSDGRLRVEVTDTSDRLPRRRDSYGAATVGGHGLLLVDELADAWGVDPRPRGKVVWCEVTA